MMIPPVDIAPPAAALPAPATDATAAVATAAAAAAAVAVQPADGTATAPADGAVGAAGAPVDRQCLMPGCTATFMVNQKNVVVQDAARIAGIAATHQRAEHAGQGQHFRVRHQSVTWAAHLVCCEHCGHDCYARGTFQTQHTKGKTHLRRVAAAAGAAPAGPAALPAAAAIAAQPPPPAPAVVPPGPAWSWNLSAGSKQRLALDSRSTGRLLKHQLLTVCKARKQFWPLLCAALVFVLQQMKDSSPDPDVPVTDAVAAVRAGECAAWCKLWHLTPMLLLSPDGRLKRSARFHRFAVGDIDQLLADEMHFADVRARGTRQAQTWELLRERAPKAARRSGGLSSTARAFQQGPGTAAPANQETADKLRRKHPAGEDAGLLRAEVAAAEADMQAAEATAAAAGAPVRRPIEFTRSQVRTTVMKARSDAAPGPSGLRVGHLQSIVRTAGADSANELLDLLAWLGTASFAKAENLPGDFWTLHMAARLSAVGEKARPIACGDTVRRLLCATYCRVHKSRFAALFEAVDQLGVGTPGGVERLAARAQLVHQAGGVVLALDGRNAFNATSRRAIYRQVAKHAPDLFAYVKRMYGPDVHASLLYALEGHSEPALILSQQGVQQGDPLGPLLFALALWPLMLDFKTAFPDVSLPGYLDDLTLLCLSSNGLQADLTLLKDAFAWVKERLALVGIDVNMDKGKTTCLLPAAAAPPPHVTVSVAAWASVELGGVSVTQEGGIILAGVPVGSSAYVQQSAARLLQTAESDRLVFEIAGCRDTQLAFALLRMCYLTRATYLTRNVGPSDLIPALRRFDATVLGALAAIMQEPLATSDDAVIDQWDMLMTVISAPDWDGEVPVAFTALQQRQVRLRQALGGFGLPSHVSRCYAAFLGRTASALPLAFRGLPVSQWLVMSDRLLRLPLMRQVRAAMQALRGVGLTDAQLLAGTPASWATWAFAAPDDEAEAQAADALLAELNGDEAADVARRLQAKLCAHVDALDAVAVRTGVADVGNFGSGVEIDAGDADAAAAEAKAAAYRSSMAKMRFQSQCGKGAMAYLSVPPSTSRKFSIRADHLREAMRGRLISFPQIRAGCAPFSAAKLPVW